MNIFFSDQIIYALGWTLLHSLWQIGLAALVLYFFISLSKHQISTFRYAIAIGMMAISVVLVICTFCYTYLQYQPAPQEPVAQVYPMPSPNYMVPSDVPYATRDGKDEITSSYFTFSDIRLMVEHSAPTLVIVWICGVVILSLRFLGAFAYTRRLKHHADNTPHHYWQTQAQKLAISIGLDKKIRVMSSVVAKVPMVIGQFKPVILLPASLVVSLLPDQLEAVLAHELAHIHRKDYWINILQSMAEIIFFYHPALWWMSSVIRTERENCCDDLAVALCGNTITYAKALAHIEESWQQSTGYAMAVTGKRGSLLQRIERLLHPNLRQTYFSNKYVSALAMLFILLTAGTGMAYKAYEAPLHKTVVKIMNIPQVNAPDHQDINKAAEKLKRHDMKQNAEKQPQPVPIEDPCRQQTNHGAPCVQDHSLQETDRKEAITDTLLPLSIEEEVDVILDMNLDSLWDSDIDLDVDPAIAMALDTVPDQYLFNFSEDDSAFQFQFDVPDAPDVVWGWSMPPAPLAPDTLFPPHSFFSDTVKMYGHPIDSVLQQFRMHFRDSLTQKRLADALSRAEENVLLLRKRFTDSLGSFDFSLLQPAWERQEEALRAQSEALARQAEHLRKRAEAYERRAEALERKAKENSFEQSTRILEKELLEDGLIKKGEQYRFEIKRNQLKVNGKKQSQQNYEKYADLLKNLMNVNVENEGNFSLTKTPYQE